MSMILLNLERTLIDSYLIKNNYIESNQILFERHNRIFYKVDLSEVLDGDIESGHGIEINEEEWELKGEEVPEIEYMKDFYFIEFIPTNDASSTTKTARLVLLYIDKYGKRQAVYAWKLVPTDKTPIGKKEDISNGVFFAREGVGMPVKRISPDRKDNTPTGVSKNRLSP